MGDIEMGTIFLIAIVLFAVACVFKARTRGDFAIEAIVLLLALALEFVVIVPKVGW
jgi:hypothetical protein